jgi:hypothetical protein
MKSTKRSQAGASKKVMSALVYSNNELKRTSDERVVWKYRNPKLQAVGKESLGAKTIPGKVLSPKVENFC